MVQRYQRNIPCILDNYHSYCTFSESRQTTKQHERGTSTPRLYTFSTSHQILIEKEKQHKRGTSIPTHRMFSEPPSPRRDGTRGGQASPHTACSLSLRAQEEMAWEGDKRPHTPCILNIPPNPDGKREWTQEGDKHPHTPHVLWAPESNKRWHKRGTSVPTHCAYSIFRQILMEKENKHKRGTSIPTHCASSEPPSPRSKQRNNTRGGQASPYTMYSLSPQIQEEAQRNNMRGGQAPPHTTCSLSSWTQEEARRETSPHTVCSLINLKELVSKWFRKRTLTRTIHDTVSLCRLQSYTMKQ